MTHTSRSTTDPELTSLLDEMLASGTPPARALETALEQAPEHAEELADFVAEWALQDALPEELGSSEPPESDTWVARASEEASRRRQITAATSDASTAPGSSVHGPAATGSPFAGRSPAELRDVAEDVGLDLTLLAKLRDRKIVAKTVPPRLADELAARLEVPEALLWAHLEGPVALPVGVSFKARRPLAAPERETFAEAVERSLLDAERREAWLAEASDSTD